MKKGLKSLLVVSSLFLASGMIVSCNNGKNNESGDVHRSYTGNGEPPATLGTDGDTYTDLNTNNMYKKENGVWVLVKNNTPRNYSGEGAPSDTLGNNGDRYTDTIDGAIYEKQDGHWVVIQQGDTTYVVTFNLNGGHFANGATSWPDQIVREGRWITAPTMEPIKEHCTFLGWFAEGSTVAWNFVGQSVFGNVNLVAHYSVNEDDKIVVTVDPNNGQAKYTYETFVGDYYYPSVPTKDGYSFTGWIIQSTGEKYNGIVTAQLAGNTLVAQWEKSKFNVVYQIEANDEVTITGILDINSVTLSIPSTIGGRRVTKISKGAFNSRIYLVSIYIPDSVKVIEDGAFRGTRALKEVNVDSNNTNYTSVGGLLYTKDMQTLVLCPTKAKAGESFTCPSTLKRIGAYAFYDSKDAGLKNIFFNEGLEEIGSYAFYLNETITSVDFPSTLKVIKDHAFYGPTYSTEDDDDYFSPQGVLKTVKFNEGLEEIGEAAFANQYFENTFTLPASVKTLGDYAFVNCTAITKFIFPAGLENYGKNVFAGCTGILDIGIAAGNTHFKVQDGVLYNFEMTKAIMCPSGRRDPVTIPEGVTELADYAFYMCDNLLEYNLPNTLQRIGVECFAHTYDLRNFVIPNSVTEMGHNAFDLSGVTNITIGTGLTELPEEAFIETKISNVNIPGNIKKIGNGAFSLCYSLSTLTLNEGLEEIAKSAFYRTRISQLNMPNTLKTIGDNAFSQAPISDLDIKRDFESLGVNVFSDANGLTSITDITVSSDNTRLAANNNLLLSKDNKTLFFAAKTAGTINGKDSSGKDTYAVTIPNGVETINEYAFAYCKSITAYTFPNTLKTIGDGAFLYTKAPKLNFPSSLRSIGDGAFYYAYTTEVSFAEGLETIGESSFAMSDLKAVALPNSIKSIGVTSFAKCMMLKTMSLGTGIETIGDCAFMDTILNCDVVIPASATTIGYGLIASSVSTYGQTVTSIQVDAANPNYCNSSDGKMLMDKAQTTVYALAGSATSITVPEGVTTIAQYGLAADKCAATSISLPSTLTTIEYGAFAGLQKIGAVNIPASVTYVGESAFAYWTSRSAINFNCSLDYALTNFHRYYLSSCNAVVTYLG